MQRFQSGELLADIKITTCETLIGFAVGAVGGSVLGLLLWYSRFISDLAAPFIAAIGAIPVLAIAPITIIWFGTEMLSKVVIVAFSCVVVSLTTSYKGALRTDPDLINLLRSFNASRTVIFIKLVVPSAMLWVVSGLRLNVGFALVGAIVGEYIIIVAAVLVPFHPIQRRQVPLLCLLAFTFGFIHFALLLLGMRYTDAGSAAMLVQMGTPMAMVLATVWLKERLSLRQIIGVGCALSGVMVLSGSPALSSWHGPVLLLISAGGWAVTTILIKRSPPIPPLAMTGWLSLFAIPLVSLSSCLTEQHQLALLLAAGWGGFIARWGRR